MSDSACGFTMIEEIFDVVNERDEVIGQATRQEVHRKGLKHRATHVLVFNSRGKVFLQKRSVRKDRQPGLWDSSASEGDISRRRSDLAGEIKFARLTEGHRFAGIEKNP